MSDEQDTHWLYGWHTVLGVARHQPQRLRRVLLTEGTRTARRRELLALLEGLNLRPEILSHTELEQIVKGVHQGVAALCESSEETTEAELFVLLETLSHPPLLLLLDRVQDPRNFGACLRVAQAAGCDALVVEKRKTAPLSAAALKAASGAAGQIPLCRVSNLPRLLRNLRQRDIWIYGADLQGDHSLFKMKLEGGVAWVLGGESSGLRPEVQRFCDYKVQIPMAGKAESLNTSVAAAVCLFETRRQIG